MLKFNSYICVYEKAGNLFFRSGYGNILFRIDNLTSQLY